MHAAKIVGWVLDGAVYCTDHKPPPIDAPYHDDKPTPIFASEEGWEGYVCDEPHDTREDGSPVFESLGSFEGVVDEDEDEDEDEDD
jgi:hypothetical protein